MAQIIDLIGRVATDTYEGVNSQIAVTDPQVNTTQHEYDALNRRVAAV